MVQTKDEAGSPGLSGIPLLNRAAPQKIWLGPYFAWDPGTFLVYVLFYDLGAKFW